jgi:hypothetical protein
MFKTGTSQFFSSPSCVCVPLSTILLLYRLSQMKVVGTERDRYRIFFPDVVCFMLKVTDSPKVVGLAHDGRCVQNSSAIIFVGHCSRRQLACLQLLSQWMAQVVSFDVFLRK